MTTKAKKANRIIWLVIAILIVIFLFRLDNPFLQAQVAVQGPDEKSTTLKIEVIDNIGSMIRDAELIPSLDIIPKKEVPIKDRYFEMPTDLIEKNRPPDGEDVLVKKHLRISPEDFDRIKDENTTAEDVKKIIIDAIIAYYGSSYDKYEISVMPEKRPLPQGKETAEKEPPSKGKKTADKLVDDLIDLTSPKKDQLGTGLSGGGTGPLGDPSEPGDLTLPPIDQPGTGPLGDPSITKESKAEAERKEKERLDRLYRNKFFGKNDGKKKTLYRNPTHTKWLGGWNQLDPKTKRYTIIFSGSKNWSRYYKIVNLRYHTEGVKFILPPKGPIYEYTMPDGKTLRFHDTFINTDAQGNRTEINPVARQPSEKWLAEFKKWINSINDQIAIAEARAAADEVRRKRRLEPDREGARRTPR